jgi:hypothetical protein
MNQARWQQIEPILDKALQLGKEEREKYVSKKCSADTELYRQVMLILQSIEKAKESDFLIR